jgi:hypothetical protein
VAPDPLEHGVAVVESVRQDVDPRIVPIDEPAIEPDLLERADPHHGKSHIRRRI